LTTPTASVLLPPKGATIVTHDSNKAFLEQSLAAPRTIQPDKLTLSASRISDKNFS
jgi:hypothetical protein